MDPAFPSCPQDLRALSLEELSFVAADLRHEIVQTCLRNGGHLGASLGTVELTLALHRVFDSPREPLIWDVGHQAYAHKLLTGRSKAFGTLRRLGGISGFLSRAESPHDVFGAGHSSTALSVALAIAWAKHREAPMDWTVAIVGDGGLTAGLAFEALNNIRSLELAPLLLVLNDNQMSIAPNVGAVSGILNEGLAEDFFDRFGLDYLGPVDGHDLGSLIGTLEMLRSQAPARPIVLHVLTQKGKGYVPAEEQPAAYHGISPIQSKVVATGTSPKRTYSDAFGAAICKLAEEDPRVVAITAAMPDGTGLAEFARRFPNRLFDVGIAEGHAVTFAAGLAVAGWKPVVAIYSTFFQRAIDSVIHDVALQKLNVVFAVDRAGWVGADGPTHHGVFDLVYFGMIPGMRVEAPACLDDVERQLRAAFCESGPVAIRYPRGGGPATLAYPLDDEVRIVSEVSESEQLIVGLGQFAQLGVEVAEKLRKKNPALKLGVAAVSRAKPVPTGLIDWIKRHPHARVAVLEAGTECGGFVTTVMQALGKESGRVQGFAYPDRFMPHGAVSELEKQSGLDAGSIAESIDRSRTS